MRLGEVIRRWRAMSELDQAQVAKEIGVSAACLSRLEAGKGIDGQHLATILCWLLESPNKPEGTEA